MRLPSIALLVLFAAPALALDTLEGPVMPATPSGAGDPAAVVCRAPQALPGGALGPKVCMHNSVWLRLSLTGQDLDADGKSVVARPTVDEPDGRGNPDAVTCRRPVPLTASRTRRGPEICLTNGQWAGLAAKHMRVDADGTVVNAMPTGPVTAGGFPIAAVRQSPAL